jgi:8-oxo-dGTP diphosphatase
VSFGSSNTVETPVVRAAGGVVFRASAGKQLEVLLVHRPAYDDWTFPKGKATPGESDVACALREVEEETGLSCEVVGEIGQTRYVDARGRAKVVRYFSMRPLDGTFAPHDEVDQVRWLTAEQARSALTYDRDRGLLDELAEA